MARTGSNPGDDAAARFARLGERHRFTARRGTVTVVTSLVDSFIRVTVSGPEFVDFASTGPADHVRAFFPDKSGQLFAPRAAGADVEGILPADGPTFGRDFTPLNLRVDPITGAKSFDLDILLHADPGPAARWARTARPGEPLVIVGPRGSRRAPQDVARILLVVDGTSLPSATRWLDDANPDTAVEIVVDVPGDLAWASQYLALSGHPKARITPAGADLGATIAAIGIDAETYVFAAGDASRLIGVRKLLKHQLALDPAQYTVSGYWKSGEPGFDHHRPLSVDAED